MAQASSSKCNLCDLNTGVYFCYECKTAICKPCKTIHSNIPASRNHSVTDLNQVDRAAYTFVSECKTHKQELSLYCSDCECLICSKCVTSLHNNHKFCDVENAVKEARKTAGLQVFKLKETMQSSSTIIKEIEAKHLPELQKRQKQTQNITANVTSVIQESKQIIDNRGKIKITEYEDFLSFETERTEKYVNTMRQNYKKQVEACSILNNVLREQHGIKFLSAYQILKCDLADVPMITPSLMKPISKPPAIDDQTIKEDLIQSLCIQFKIRLNDVASRQRADGTFAARDDQNEPRRLGQRFHEVFEDAWSEAYEVLKPKKTSKEDDQFEMDEKTIQILQNVVKVIFEFCKKVADNQVSKLMTGMVSPIFNPMDTMEVIKTDDTETVRKTEKMAKDYRQAVASATIHVLKQNITQELQGKLLPADIGKELKEYVDYCVNLIWYMCIQQPPMEIVWGKRGETFNKEMFRFSGKKGTKLRLMVWPAVLYHKGGALAAPGYAVPE